MLLYDNSVPSETPCKLDRPAYIVIGHNKKNVPIVVSVQEASDSDADGDYVYSYVLTRHSFLQHLCSERETLLESALHNIARSAMCLKVATAARELAEDLQIKQWRKP